VDLAYSPVNFDPIMLKCLLPTDVRIRRRKGSREFGGIIRRREGVGEEDYRKTGSDGCCSENRKDH